MIDLGVEVTNIRKVEEEKEVYDVKGVVKNSNYLTFAKDNNSSTENSAPIIVNHNCGILDEVEFFPGADRQMLKSKIMDIYRTVKRRIESRFMKSGGEIPGMLFMVSSKKSEHDFLQQYISEVEQKDNIKVVDESIWTVKPIEVEETFKVAVGDKYLESKILEEGEEEETYKKQGYRIIEVPEQYRDSFELNVNAALMDNAGIAIASTTKFIYGTRYEKCVDESKVNPFDKEILTMAFEDTGTDIKDFFDPSKIPDRDRSRPMFAHIDLSKSGDRTGLSLIAVKGSTKTERLEDGQVFEVTDLVYELLFALAIEAAKGSEIPYYKIREFYYYLRDELGFDIKGISCDGYQSVDMIQQFNLHGYDAETISVDRTTDPYYTLRSAINEQRFITYDHSLLEHELLNLQEDRVNNKIDHKEDTSKDISDSIAGAVYNASTHEDMQSIVEKNIDMNQVVDTLNTINEDEDKMTQNLEEQILGEGKRVARDENEFRELQDDTIMGDYIDELMDN